MNKHFLRVLDMTPDEIKTILERAAELKSGKDASACPLIGKSVGLLFEKSSTRTRVSFEVGVYELGGHPLSMNLQDIQLDRGESIPDTAKTLSRFLSAVAIRTSAHERIEEFASNASIPVINALTDLHHPCQALADVLTVKERMGRLKGIRMAYIGDGNNVANSLIEAAAVTGMDIVIACPEGYEPDAGVLKDARDASSGSRIDVIRDPREAASKADVLYTDTWVSMGQEEEKEKRIKAFAGYQVNEEMLSLANPKAIVMHCLPAYRGYEISAAVLDGPQSAVFNEAENRLHAQKALMEFLLK